MRPESEIEKAIRELVDRGVKLVPNEIGENAAYLVCAPAGQANATTMRYLNPALQNIQGTCCKCGCAVAWRPYQPTKPPRICVRCFCTMLDEENKAT